MVAMASESPQRRIHRCFQLRGDILVSEGLSEWAAGEVASGISAPRRNAVFLLREIENGVRRLFGGRFGPLGSRATHGRPSAVPWE